MLPTRVHQLNGEVLVYRRSLYRERGCKIGSGSLSGGFMTGGGL